METTTIDQLRDKCLQWLAEVAGDGAKLDAAEARIRELFDAHLAAQAERGEAMADKFEIGDILYRIDSDCLIGGITDAQFREFASPVLEDIRGYFLGCGYEICTPYAEAAKPPAAGVPDGWIEALCSDLVIECEQAMRQRDEFLKTGNSKCSHGGSHDTCFGIIVRRHLESLSAAPEAKPHG